MDIKKAHQLGELVDLFVVYLKALALSGFGSLPALICLSLM
jgi:hypothetical protein